MTSIVIYMEHIQLTNAVLSVLCCEWSTKATGSMGMKWTTNGLKSIILCQAFLYIKWNLSGKCLFIYPHSYKYTYISFQVFIFFVAHSSIILLYMKTKYTCNYQSIVLTLFTYDQQKSSKLLTHCFKKNQTSCEFECVFVFAIVCLWRLLHFDMILHIRRQTHWFQMKSNNLMIFHTHN